MKEEWLTAINEMRDAGYAVCVFTAEDLKKAVPRSVEIQMCEAAWDEINYQNNED